MVNTKRILRITTAKEPYLSSFKPRSWVTKTVVGREGIEPPTNSV
jgi:hypothetical protein